MVCSQKFSVTRWASCTELFILVTGKKVKLRAPNWRQVACDKSGNLAEVFPLFPLLCFLISFVITNFCLFILSQFLQYTLLGLLLRRLTYWCKKHLRVLSINFIALIWHFSLSTHLEVFYRWTNNRLKVKDTLLKKDLSNTFHSCYLSLKTEFSRLFSLLLFSVLL